MSAQTLTTTSLFLCLCLSTGCSSTAPDEETNKANSAEPLRPAPGVDSKQSNPLATALIGRWEQNNAESEPRVVTKSWAEFTADGQCVQRSVDSQGQQIRTTTYRVEGDRLLSPEQDAPFEVGGKRVVSRVTRIESLTEEKLVLLHVTGWKWTMKRATELSAVHERPIEDLLAETWEERARTVAYRVR